MPFVYVKGHDVMMLINPASCCMAKNVVKELVNVRNVIQSKLWSVAIKYTRKWLATVGEERSCVREVGNYHGADLVGIQGVATAPPPK